MMTKVRLLAVGLALCMMAAPVSALPDLFGFSFSNTRDTFDGISSFRTTDWMQTMGDVYRNIAPAGSALLLPGMWNVGGTWEGFLLTMTITNFTATSAEGSGSFAIKDIDGDTIAGNVSGAWTKDGDGGKFFGSLSNVTYISSVDDTFDGHLGTGASMIFGSPQPWSGSLVEMTMDGAWFTWGTGGTLHSFDVNGGSVDATVAGEVIPAPGAFLLSLLGLGAVGLRRRWFT